MTNRWQQLRALRRQLPLVILALALGLGDLLLLMGAAGVAEPQQSRAQVEATLRRVGQQIDQTQDAIRKATFPTSKEVENLSLVVAAIAARHNLQLTSFNSNVTPRSLAGKEYNVLDAGLEVRGRLPSMVSFLQEVQTSLVSTLQVQGATLRKEEETWILTVQVLVYYQR